MNLKLILIVRSTIWSITLTLFLIMVQSAVPSSSVFTSSAYAKAAKSPYKKAFSGSKRISSKKSIRRSGLGNCLQWEASKINDKASKFKAHIEQFARQYSVDQNLIKAVITAESCFRVKALSNKGAQGLMQLIPATARRFGVKNSYKPKQNIHGGTKYLRFLIDRFNGDLKKVLASYNAGEGAVDKYKGIPPYKETKQYVKNVLQVYAVLNPRNNKQRVKHIYLPPSIGGKAGRQGWQYNRSIAPHLYKQ